MYLYMSLAGWGVGIVKNCDRGLENATRGRTPWASISVITLAASPARSYKKAKLNTLSLQLKKNDVYMII